MVFIIVNITISTIVIVTIAQLYLVSEALINLKLVNPYNDNICVFLSLYVYMCVNLITYTSFLTFVRS